MSVKTTGDGLTGFVFFEHIEPQLVDPSVTAIAGATVDRLGYETVVFAITHSAIGSGAGGLVLNSVVDAVDVFIVEASQSAAGIDAWSACSAGDVFGVDYVRMMSVLTIDSWLVLNELTRASYPLSIPVWASCASGQVLALGISTTSAASLLTTSYMWTIGYKGKRRYVRLEISASTNVSLIPLACTAVLGMPGNWPATMIR